MDNKKLIDYAKLINVDTLEYSPTMKVVYDMFMLLTDSVTCDTDCVDDLNPVSKIILDRRTIIDLSDFDKWMDRVNESAEKYNEHERVIISDIVALLGMMTPEQRIATFHIAHNLYGIEFLEDKKQFEKYKQAVRKLQKFKTDKGEPFVCCKCKKVHNIDTEFDKVLNLPQQISEGGSDISLFYSLMFTFTTPNRWICCKCFDPDND